MPANGLNMVKTQYGLVRAGEWQLIPEKMWILTRLDPGNKFWRISSPFPCSLINAITRHAKIGRSKIFIWEASCQLLGDFWPKIGHDQNWALFGSVYAQRFARIRWQSRYREASIRGWRGNIANCNFTFDAVMLPVVRSGFWNE